MNNERPLARKTIGEGKVNDELKMGAATDSTDISFTISFLITFRPAGRSSPDVNEF